MASNSRYARASRQLAVLVVTAAVFAGCGGSHPNQAPITQPTTDGALITYTRSGGIAATTQHLTVRTDGSATVSVEGPGDIGADFRLSHAEFAELNSAIGDATLEGEAPPTGCADCYSYVISADGATASFDETQVPSGTEHLVSLCERIIERETPTGPARNG